MADIDPWESARTLFMKDLSIEEQKIFETSTLDNLLESAVAAQKEHEENSHSRHISKKLEPFVSAIDQYGCALDVYSNTYSIAMAPLWGSIRVLLHIAESFEKYFQKLIDMLERIGDVLPRCQIYQNLFSTNKKLLQAISIAYVDVIHFCWTAKKAFRKMKKSTTIHLTLKLCWKDLNKEFEEKITAFRNHVKKVEKEAGISGMIETHQGWALAEHERKLNKRHQLLSSLSDIKYISKFQSERKKRHKGTGSWLIETPEFKDWKTEIVSNCLWCYGIPGSGKTVLTSSTIQLLAEDILGTDITVPITPIHDLVSGKITRRESAIIYHFCEFSDPQSLEPTIILGTLIRQLLETIVIPETLEKRIERCFSSRTRHATPEELFQVFEDAIAQFSTIYILVDGIDECRNEDITLVLSMFDRLLQRKIDTSMVKIIHFSRYNDVISGFLNLHSRLEISTEKVTHDINIYIEQTVRSKIASGELEASGESLENEVVTRLKDGAHGMFLWVYFQLLDLCEAISEFEVRETLGRLPGGIIETYTRILMKIVGNRSNKTLAQQTFKWIVCAKRPMFLFELTEAVAFKATDTSWSREKIPNPERLYKACGNLVVVDDEDKTVRLVHHTVQQFLLEPLQHQALELFQISPRRAEIELGEVCVAYLSFSDFETQIAISNRQILSLSCLPDPKNVLEHVSSQPGPSNISSSMSQVICRFRSEKRSLRPTDFDVSKFLKVKTPPSRTLQERYLLLDYVVQNWLHHTSSFSVSDTSMWESFRNLALNKSLPFDIRPWGDINELRERPYAALIAWAIKAQHLPLLQLLPQNCHIPEGVLHEAILNENPAIAEVLLTKRANTEAEDNYGDTVLLEAAARGHTRILELLLIKGMKTELKHVYEEMLFVAVNRGHVTMVELLMAKGVNVNATDPRDEKTALHWAALRGRTAIVELLIANGSRIHATDKNEDTALHIAATQGQITTIERLLIAGGPIVNAVNKNASTALHLAVAAGHTDVVALLIAKGANVHKTDSLQQTALHKAITKNYSTIVKLLIANKADVNARDHDRRTALHMAVHEGHLTMVELLIANEANVNAKDQRDRTALHQAIMRGDAVIAKLLIAEGADVEARSMTGMTALQRALHRGHEPIVELLVTNGADINAWSKNKPVLHLAAERGNTKIVHLLLANGANINAIDWGGGTALDGAIAGGHIETVGLLKEYGATLELKRTTT